jgi:peptide/nickel transport system substrate-binding protein
MALILFFFGLAACSRQAPHADFTLALESFPATLDPRYPTDAYSGKVQGLIFNGLMKWDDRLMLVPDLAESLEFLSDTRMRFVLRRGVVFHDGKTFTARDVLYTFKTVMDPKYRSPHYSTFNKIAELEAKDDQTIEIELKEPFAPFLTALTLGIIPENADRGPTPFAKRPVGTGPFRFSQALVDQWVLLTANPHSFEGVPSLGSVLIRTVRDDTTRVLAMLRREVDLVQNAVPLVMAPWLQKHGGLKMRSDLGINYVYLAFNLNDPLLQDRRVREAVALAVSRKALIEYRLKGFAREATGLLAPSSEFYNGKVETYGYDPERAKTLLTEAGFPDPDGEGPRPRMKLVYKTSNKRDRVAMARAIAQDLKAVGIEVEVRPYEWGTFFRDIRTGNFQIYSSTWVGVTDPDIYYLAFHSDMAPPKGANRGFYRNPELDILVEKARLELESAARRKIYAKVQEIVAHDLPYVSLWWEDNVVFTQESVEGYELRPDASLIGLTKTEKAKTKVGVR